MPTPIRSRRASRPRRSRRDAASYDPTLREYLLPYDASAARCRSGAARRGISCSPPTEAAADLGGWDRAPGARAGARWIDGARRYGACMAEGAAARASGASSCAAYRRLATVPVSSGSNPVRPGRATVATVKGVEADGVFPPAAYQWADAGLDLRVDRHRLHDGLRHHRHDQLRPWRHLHGGRLHRADRVPARWPPALGIGSVAVRSCS